MSLTHRDLADLVAALYDAPDSVPWLYRSNLDANVYMGIIRQGGAFIVATRGSFDFEDWLHDLRAKPTKPVGRPELQKVHAGFYGGTPEAWDIIAEHMDDEPVVFCGHSLGAARAVILAGHMLAVGFQPTFVCRWGEPAALFPEGNEFIKDVPGVSYCNGVGPFVDAVTQSTLPFGYRHSVSLTNVSASPGKVSMLDPFALHHFALYQSVTPTMEI
jgi:hypothetical protein